MADADSYRDDPDLHVYEAEGARDVLRIRREVEGRRWAAAHGIPTPEVVAVDPEGRWLVSRRVPDEPGEPPAYVAAALDVARRIQRLPHPRFATPGSTWRAPRRALPVRVARLVRAGVDPRAFVAARRAYEELPREATLHNDFHRANVLNTTATSRRVTVVDWEFTGVGPRHEDMVRLVVDLRDPGVARAAWDLLVGSVPVADRPALAVQLRWLSLRTYAVEVTVPPSVADLEQAERRRVRWREAQEWAGELAPSMPETRRDDD